MNRICLTIIAAGIAISASAATSGAGRTIRIATDSTDLILKVGDNGRLYQTYLGTKLLHEEDIAIPDWWQYAGSDGAITRRGWEAYPSSGTEDYFEPAIGITHADGNMSTYLYYVDSSTED